MSKRVIIAIVVLVAVALVALAVIYAPSIAQTMLGPQGMPQHVRPPH